MPIPQHPQLDVAREAARAAGHVLRRFFRGTFSVRVKDGPDVVTEADLEAERTVIRTIESHFPGHQFLAEESHRSAADSDHLWVIDPLDGTTNFLHGVPQFAVSIAYYEKGRPVCGVIHNPVYDEWYVALAGQGAWFNDAPARVSPSASLEKVLLATGFYYDRGPLMEGTVAAVGDIFRQGVHCIRRMGAASLDLAYVGTGRFGAYFEYLLSPWDFAAGRLFVEEAGGRVTTCQGTPLTLTRSTILASNGLLHDAVYGLVAKHVPPGA